MSYMTEVKLDLDGLIDTVLFHEYCCCERLGNNASEYHTPMLLVVIHLSVSKLLLKTLLSNCKENGRVAFLISRDDTSGHFRVSL